jgi:2-desacetyl-2-hydroxyethyl bacteriochlorophyllide A dehydrogenase
MKTIILQEPGKFRLDDASVEPRESELAAGEALVRVRRVGICGTDLHAFRGKQPFFTYPRILGHELGVEVVAVDPSSSRELNIRPGDHCAVEPYLNCGACVACRAGKTNCCVKLQCLGVHTDGGMRELIRVPARKLHKSERLTLEQLALVETLGIGAHAVVRGGPQKNEQVLVIGAGPIGLSVVQFAKIDGARVTTIDVNQKRLDFCKQRLNVDATVLAGQDLEENIRKVTETCGGELPTLVFDATGNPQSMHNAFKFVANGGRLVFVGLFVGDVTFNDPEFHRREMTLLATRNSTANEFKRIIALMESGKIDTTPWITHRAACGEMIGQFETWLDPNCGVIKAMVEF